MWTFWSRSVTSFIIRTNKLYTLTNWKTRETRLNSKTKANKIGAYYFVILIVKTESPKIIPFNISKVKIIILFNLI